MNRPSTFQTFLSYNSLDRPVVLKVAAELARRDCRCFVDQWYLAPGRDWVSALEKALAESRSVAVFLGAGEMGRWQQRERAWALDRYAENPDNFAVVPVLLPGCQPPLGFLKQLTWIDLRDDPADSGQLDRLAAALRGEPLRDEGQRQPKATVCPYRGLLYFREEDAEFFFGRDEYVQELVAMVDKSESRLVAVVGASGSGKSSVVRAGLVPRLRARSRDADKLRTVWDIVTMVPRTNPFQSLADALLPLGDPQVHELPADQYVARRNEFSQGIFTGKSPLADVVDIILQRQAGTNRLLLVVDQWEELYTECEDSTARQRFIDELLDATGRKQSRLSVVFTVRSDFYGEIMLYRPLLDRLRGGKLELGPMTRDELRAAIEEPVKNVGLNFQQGLVDRLLIDAGEEPGRLALLEFALEELWKRQDHHELTHEAYKALGQLSGAIATRAEEVYGELTPDEQAAAPALFRRLVRAGAKTEDDTRRRADFASLDAVAQRVARKLADRRLLVISRVDSSGGGEQSVETVEVAHEELLRRWSRLGQWVNADRKFLQWRARLAPLIDEHRRDAESALLRHGALREARQYYPARQAELEAAERKFVEASVRAERRRKIVMSVWSVATLTLLFGIGAGAWWEIQRSKDRDVIDSAVANLPISKAADAAVYLENLRRRPDYAAAQLRAAYNAEQEPSRKLRLAYGLMAVAAVTESTDDVARFVLDHVADVSPEENRLFVEALSRLTDVESVRKELHSRSDLTGAVDEKGAVDEGEIVLRTHRALAAMSLGRMEAAERLRVADGDPTQRTVFIRDFAQWPIRPPQEFGTFLSRVQDAEVRSGLCIALGGVDPRRWTEEDRAPLREQLLRLYQDDPDSGVHSAAGWALTEWQVTLPDLPRTPAPPNESLAGGRSWFVNSLGMTMVQVPKDEKRKYRIGSKQDDDNPVREVNVARCWLSACEVTVEQFQTLQAKDDSKQAGVDSTGALELVRPVTDVTWYDAVNYCNLLSEREGFPGPYYYEISEIQRDSDGRIESAKVKSGVGHGYCLPTEVEWEVACRAGTTTEFSFGNQERDLGDYGWFDSNSGGDNKLVASKRPNPWGLHDMHGNVNEWCEDDINLGATPDENPDRVVRGGCWIIGARYCRSAFRDRDRADYSYRTRGFRVCLVPGPVAVPQSPIKQ